MSRRVENTTARPHTTHIIFECTIYDARYAAPGRGEKIVRFNDKHRFSIKTVHTYVVGVTFIQKAPDNTRTRTRAQNTTA